MEPRQTAIFDELIGTEQDYFAVLDRLIDEAPREHRGVALTFVMTRIAALQQYFLQRDYRTKKPGFSDLESEAGRAEWRWRRHQRSSPTHQQLQLNATASRGRDRSGGS